MSTFSFSFPTTRAQAQTGPLRALLRGIGQIVLQRNAATGALLFAAVLSQSARLACALVIGAVTGNVLASIVDTDDSPSARQDLNAFNGALAALAAFAFIRDDSQAGAVAIVAAMLATFLAVKLAPYFARVGLPLFSSPAVVVTWLWLPLFADSTAVTPAVWPVPGAVLAGLSPILFASGVLAGALVCAALAVSGVRCAGVALAGSALGLALHAMSGAPATLLLSGACGFNSALVALATSRAGTRRMLGAVAVCVAIERAAAYFGFPALTAPFVLAAWFMHATTRSRSASGIADRLGRSGLLNERHRT
jgi:urea transporter